MLNIEELKFDEKGLIPAIVVDANSKKVLTLAYMNKESLKISMEEGLPASGLALAKSFGERVRPRATVSTSLTSLPTVTVTHLW